MTNKELRRKKLADLIAEYGSQKALGDAVGKDPAMFSQILNVTRGLGDKLARDLEEKLGKPRGWFDLYDSDDIVKHVPTYSWQELVEEGNRLGLEFPLNGKSIEKLVNHVLAKEFS
ncbi:MAG: hypothetical protein M1579_01360 [Gammaproteobacteria bacterium]|nr:hypothetical protein [Gammaproteobacteria bacterium]